MNARNLREPLERARHQRWLGLAGLLLAEAMNLLDSTITTVVAPVVRSDLGGTAADTQWVVAAYTLSFAILLILGGRLGDMFSQRRIFLIGVLGFLVTSALCAAAPTMAVLLASRAVQGAFAAMIIPQTIGLIKAMFAGADLPRALSFIGPAMGITAVAGPVLGGLLTAANIGGLSWRSVFLVNLPLGVLVLISLPFIVEVRADRKPRLDLAGFALAALACASYVVPTISGADTGWPGWTWASFGVGAVATLLLALHVRRAGRTGRDSIVEPSLFHDRGFPAALVSSLLYFGLSTGIVFMCVVFLENNLGLSVVVASLTVLPFSIGLAVGSLVAGQLIVPRVGTKLMPFGISLLVAGLVVCLVTALTSQGVAYPVLLPIGLGIAGLGGGFTTVALFTAALGRVQPHETGSAAGLLNAVQQLGGTLGIAVLGSIVLNSSAVHGFGLAFALTILLALVLLGSAITMLATPAPPSGHTDALGLTD